MVKNTAARILLIAQIFFFSVQLASAQNASSLIDVMSRNAYQDYQKILEQHDSGSIDQAQVQALTMLEEARVRAHRIDEAAAQRLIGLVAIQRNQYDLALQAFTQSVNIFDQAQELLLSAQLTADIGNVKFNQAQYPAALTHYYGALSNFESMGDAANIAAQKYNIGVVLERMGQFESALQAFEQALQIQLQLNDRRGIARTLHLIAEIHRDANEFELAFTYFEQALLIHQQQGVQREIANSSGSLGQVLIQQRKYSEAKEFLDIALKIYTKLEAPKDIDRTLARLAQVQLGTDNSTAGVEQLSNLLARAINRQDTSLVTELRLALAQAGLQTNKVDLALTQSELGVAEARSNLEYKLISEFEGIRVEAFKSLGDFESAFAAQEKKNDIEAHVLSLNRSATLSAVQSEVEYIRQEQSISLLEKNKAIELGNAERRNLRNVSFLASAIVVLLLGFLMVSRQAHRVKQQTLSNMVKRRTTELERKNDELQQAYRTLEHMSLRDALTGCYNRHFLEANLPAEIKRCLHSYEAAKAKNQPFPENQDLLCFVIDIDDFKQINDTHGHVSGDRFLSQFTQVMNRVFRHSDLQIRWGGEEFLVICRNTPRRDASMLAERLRSAIEENVFLTQDKLPYRASCSIGFCAFPLIQTHAESVSWDRTFSLADQCLYSAKQSGKNCWVGILNGERIISNTAEKSKVSGFPQHLNLERPRIVTSLNNVAAIRWQPSLRSV